MNITGREIFSYSSSLFELKFENNVKEYLISYLYLGETDYYRNIALNKFCFSNFEINSLNMLKEQIIQINVHNRIANSFLMNNKIIVFYITGTFKFRFRVFDFYLNKTLNEIDIDEFVGEWPWGACVFVKGIHLKDDLLVFNYYSYKTNLRIKLGKLILNSFEEKLVANINYLETTINLNHEIILNDCTKLNDKRIILLSLSSTNSNILYILLYDFYADYSYLKIRVYQSNLFKYKLNSELTINIYNELLAFSSTALNFNDLDSDENKFSILLIFGYVNGTDIIIEDIKEYMNSEDNNSNLNIVELLTETILIKNNIFGYEPVTDKIKLVTIPDEIFFYNKSNILLKISEGDFLSKDYIFKQNLDIIKNNEYYSFEYQNIIKESEYSIFNKYPIKY